MNNAFRRRRHVRLFTRCLPLLEAGDRNLTDGRSLMPAHCMNINEARIKPKGSLFTAAVLDLLSVEAHLENVPILQEPRR